MDAVEFLNQYSRMVASGVQPFAIPPNLPYEEIVRCVDQWAKEHPVKTRQSELLKLFPGAEIRDGVLNVCPRKIDPEAYTHQRGYNCIHIKDDVLCPDCMRGFWFQEIK